MTELPAGWEIAELDELVSPQPHSLAIGPFGSNLKVSDYRTEGVPLVFVRNIRARDFDLVPTFVTQEKAAELEAHRVSPGDVLITKMGDPPGDTAIYPGARSHAVLTADCIKASPHPAISGGFLALAVQSPGCASQIAEMTSGVAQQKVSLGKIRKLQVPVAPSAEQERIVSATEEAFSKLDAGDAGLRTVRQLLRRMRDAVVTSATTGRLVSQEPTETPASKLLADLGVDAIEPDGVPDLPASWAWASLGSVADVVGGATKDSKKQDDPTFVERPYLRVANVQRGYLDLDAVTSIRVPPEKAAKLELRSGDVLFNEGGDRDKLGRGWVWEGQVDGCIHQNHVFRARMAEGFEPRLVSLWGNTFGQGWFEGHGKQTTNLASINMKTLRSFPIPVAPEAEQHRILDEVERQMSFIEACERSVETGLEVSAALRRSVLKAAFEGRLVPQDPTDEPASVLLERIRAERAATPKPKQRRAKATA